MVAEHLLWLALQVGLAFIAGLAVAVMLIPVNRWLATRIAVSSAAMMAAKDARLRAVADIIAAPRNIKCGRLEALFATRILAAREEELRNLAVRKYLDAG